VGPISPEEAQVAAPGPVPKRSDQRRRRNVPEVAVTTARPVAKRVTKPKPDPDWHPIARRWYDSLGKSGQSRFYEPSDWAQACYLAEAMTRNLADQRFSANLFAAVLSGMTELLTTEGARRRARLEIEREQAEVQKSDASDGYRRRLGVA